MQKTRHMHCAQCLWYFAIVHSTAQTSARNACSFFISVSTFAQTQAKRYGFVVFHYRSFHGTNFGTQRVRVFLYPFQRLRKRKLNGMVLWDFAIAHTNAKNSAHTLCRFINKNRHFCVAKSAFVYKKCECILHSHSFLVGVTGLEPMAS